MAVRSLVTQGVDVTTAEALVDDLGVDAELSGEALREAVLAAAEARGVQFPAALPKRYLDQPEAYEAQGFTPEEAAVHAANSRAVHEQDVAAANAANQQLVAAMQEQAAQRAAEAQAAQQAAAQEAAQQAAAEAAVAQAPTSLGEVAARAGRVDSPRLQMSMKPVLKAMQRLAEIGGFRRKPAPPPQTTEMAEILGHYQLTPSEAAVTEVTSQMTGNRLARVFDVQHEAGGKGRIYHSREGAVWVDVSEMRATDPNQPAQGGDLVYQAAATYALNNGLKLIPDPSGVTPIAGGRRISHMLSSSLRHGTTKHLLPWSQQADGTVYVTPGLQAWRTEDSPDAHAFNQDLLARAELDYVRKEAKRRGVPFERLRYNEKDGTVYNESTKRWLSTGDLKQILAGLDPGRSGIGEATFSRALAASAAIRPVQFGRRSGKPALSDPVQSGGRDSQGEGSGLFRFPRSTRPLFYSLRPVDGVGLNTLFKNTREIAQQAARLLDRQMPGIVGKRLRFFANPAELLATDYAGRESFTEAEIAAMQEAEGFFDNDTGYTVIFTDSIEVRPGETPRAAVARVILHERVGHDGFNTLLQTDQAFTKRWEALAAKIPQTELDAIAADYPNLAADTPQLALEWLARAVEQRLHLREGNLAQRLWAALRVWMNRAFKPFGGNHSTDSALRELIAQAQAAAQAGTAVPTTAAALRLQFSLADSSVPVDSPAGLFQYDYRDESSLSDQERRALAGVQRAYPGQSARPVRPLSQRYGDLRPRQAEARNHHLSTFGEQLSQLFGKQILFIDGPGSLHGTSAPDSRNVLVVNLNSEAGLGC
jgi:hypothetical protein